MYNISLSHFLVNLFHRKVCFVKKNIRRENSSFVWLSDKYTCRFDLSGAEIDYLYIGILPLGCLETSAIRYAVARDTARDKCIIYFIRMYDS